MTIQQAGSTLALLSTLFFWLPGTNADDGASKVTTRIRPRWRKARRGQDRRGRGRFISSTTRMTAQSTRNPLMAG